MNAGPDRVNPAADVTAEPDDVTADADNVTAEPDNVTASAEDVTADAVTAYYRLVDADDVEGLLDLFAPDAVYRRPGYDPFVGRDALRDFYSGERVIESGTHSVEHMVVGDDSVAVHGRFEGTLRDGSQVSLRFADFYTFTDDGRFATRDTFFFAPLV